MDANLAGVAEKPVMRILHFVETWLPRTQNWIYNHIRMASDEVETHVLCQWSQNLQEFPVQHLHSLEKPPIPMGLIGKVLFRLRLREDGKRHLALLGKVIQEVRPQVIHSHFGHFGALNNPLVASFGIPHVVSFYGLDVGYLPRIQSRWRSRYRAMGKTVQAVLCEGPYMASRIAEYGIAPQKIKIFRLGVDLSTVPFRPRLNPKPGKLRFLIAGTFREKKGIPYAIEALGKFRKEYDNLEVTVIGDAGASEREQQEKQKIQLAIRRAELGDKVRFLGYQPHEVLIDHYYSHDIFLSPSLTASDGDTEGGAPVTIIEAAASGMPVISTRNCDIPFVLSRENGDFLAPERDAIALASKIERLVSMPDWSFMLIANRELVERELDVRKQAVKLSAIYQSLAVEPVQPTPVMR